MDPDTRKLQLQTCFSKLDQTLSHMSDIVESKDIIRQAQETLSEIKEHTEDLLQMKSSSITCLQVDSLTGWKFLGAGNFGQVLECQLKGSKVAVKILRKEAREKFRESDLLRYLSHSNIVAFRGMGYISKAQLSEVTSNKSGKSDSQQIDSGHSTQSEDSDSSEGLPDVSMFIVMEFVNTNLLQYVRKVETLERHGLSDSQTWNIGQQITSALNYLHSEDIVHRDLKPDNILIEVGPARIMVKVADFGLAWFSGAENPSHKTPSVKHQYSSLSSSASSFYLNIRWHAPELYDEKCHILEDYMKGDVYSLGLILTFTVTGVKALAKISSSQLEDEVGNLTIDDTNFELPKSIQGPLREAIESCRQTTPDKRSTAEKLMQQCFAMEKNPYHVNPTQAEFFSCGFMEKTNIYVADSCIGETQKGFYQTWERPEGYDHKDLVCRIETENAPYKDRPESWSQEEISQYIDNHSKYVDMSSKRLIDNNPTTALKELVFSRPGVDESQRIDFHFKESNYCHHRSMREIWMSLSLKEKNEEVPFKGDVHKFFSNSFGLHVAVLTNEGPNKPQKFLFPQRANKKGMSSPGTYTCGAVESVSKPDYVYKDGLAYVNLVKTAARGLMEEIGLELSGGDLDAICLSTVYLKYDFHEWGLCGFIDLKDERVTSEHRISAGNIQSRFTSGPKDKFEHQTLTFVDFELEPMVKFVFDNHENFASSAKLVVVKVLQAFFGWGRVQKQFEQNT